METANLTESQLDALCDAEERDANFKALTLDEKVAALREQGHPAFDEAAPVDVGPPMALYPADGNIEARGVSGTAYAVAERDEPDETALAMAGGESVDGLDAVGAEDLLIPGIKLSQATSRDEGADVPDGKFWMQGDPEGATDTRDIAVLKFGKQRSLMTPFRKDERAAFFDDLVRIGGPALPADFDGVICRSEGAEVPVQSEAMVASRCDDCPAAKWIEGKGALCRKAYRFAVVDMTPDEDGDPLMLPAVVYLRGSAFKVGKAITTKLVLGKQRGRPTYAHKFTLKANKVQTDDGVFYQLQASGRPERITDPELLEELAGWQQMSVRARERQGAGDE